MNQDDDLILLTDSEDDKHYTYDSTDDLVDEILGCPRRRQKRPSTTPLSSIDGRRVKRRCLLEESDEETLVSPPEASSSNADQEPRQVKKRSPSVSMYKMGGKHEALPYMSVEMFYFLCERYEVEPTRQDFDLIKRHQKLRTKHVICAEVEGTEEALRLIVESNTPGNVLPHTVVHDVLKAQAKTLSQLRFGDDVRNMLRRYFSSFNGRGSVVWYERYNK